jgi:predicted aminopeptidase
MRSAIRDGRYEDAAILRDEFMGRSEDIAHRLTQDISDEIDRLGVPYRFENIRANGIAMNDFCVISNHVLNFQPHMLMFVLFHELAHHYQYRKHGHDFALSVYTNDVEKIDEDVERLKWIEDTANKFGEMKTNYYIKKYDLELPLLRTNKTDDGAMYRSHILRMKRMVAEMPPERRNIRDINEALYNSIKVDE